MVVLEKTCKRGWQSFEIMADKDTIILCSDVQHSYIGQTPQFRIECRSEIERRFFSDKTFDEILI